MRWLTAKAWRLLGSRKGQGVVEYGLILMLIVVVIIVSALGTIGDKAAKPLNETAHAPMASGN